MTYRIIKPSSTSFKLLEGVKFYELKKRITMITDIKPFIKYYIGCKVIVDDKEKGTLVGAALVPNEVDQIYYEIHLDKWPEGEIMPFNDDTSPDCRVQPILRRIESLTGDEKREWNRRKQGKGYMYQVHADNTHFLISLGIDVFGLIPAGLAIDAATIKSESK